MPRPGFNAPQEFNPARDVRVERNIIMTTNKHKIGYMKSVRAVEEGLSGAMVRDDVNSEIKVHWAVTVKSQETLWIGQNGLQRYQGQHDETFKSSPMIIDAELKGGVLEFNYKAAGEDTSTRPEIVKNGDYHWASMYFEFRTRDLEPGVTYDRRLLDTVNGITRPLKEKYLGMRYYKVGDRVLDCHVIWFDYGHVNGTIWIAEDELGPFLVYEDAIATEESFELTLTEYTKTRIAGK